MLPCMCEERRSAECHAGTDALWGDLRGSLCFPAFMSNTPEADEVAVQRVGGRPEAACGSAEEYPSSSKACVGFVAVRSK